MEHVNDHPTGYHFPAEFPREAFVQKALERHFESLGFQLERHESVDLVCHSDELKEHWVIEAKGETSQVGLDFRTGLGQLFQHMSSPSILYGIAIPETPRFLLQCRCVSEWVRRAIHLHWLIVHSDGSIRIVSPDEVI